MFVANTQWWLLQLKPTRGRATYLIKDPGINFKHHVLKRPSHQLSEEESLEPLMGKSGHTHDVLPKKTLNHTKH